LCFILQKSINTEARTLLLSKNRKPDLGNSRSKKPHWVRSTALILEINALKAQDEWRYGTHEISKIPCIDYI
jgi:hypothetical protein